MKKNKNNGKKPAARSKAAKPVYNVPADWWYLIPEEVSLRRIYDVIREEEQVKAEFWEEAGVLEIEAPGAGSLDLEAVPCSLGDEEGDAFLEKHQIRTVFAASLFQEAYGVLKPVMEKLTESLGGFFCGDTEDFTPVVGKMLQFTPNLRPHAHSSR